MTSFPFSLSSLNDGSAWIDSLLLSMLNVSLFLAVWLAAISVSLVKEEFPFHEGGGPHISRSGTLLTQGFILPQGVSNAFLLGLFGFLPRGSGVNWPFSALVDVVAIAFVVDCAFAPPSGCACALVAECGGIIDYKGWFLYALACAFVLPPAPVLALAPSPYESNKENKNTVYQSLNFF